MTAARHESYWHTPETAPGVFEADVLVPCGFEDEVNVYGDRSTAVFDCPKCGRADIEAQYTMDGWVLVDGDIGTVWL
jgi:hypothetical protein